MLSLISCRVRDTTEETEEIETAANEAIAVIEETEEIEQTEVTEAIEVTETIAENPTENESDEGVGRLVTIVPEETTTIHIPRVATIKIARDKSVTATVVMTPDGNATRNQEGEMVTDLHAGTFSTTGEVAAAVVIETETKIVV